MTSALLALRRSLDGATRALALVGFAGLVTICLITMYDGLARYLGLPRVPGLRDFGEVIFAVLIASCFPIGLLRNQNITITFLGTALGPTGARGLNLFSALATLAGFAAIAWALVERSGGLGERTTRTGYMLVAPWAWAATTILVAAVAVQVWVVLARMVEATPGETLVDDHAGVTEGGIEEGLTPTDDAYCDPGDGPDHHTSGGARR